MAGHTDNNSIASQWTVDAARDIQALQVDTLKQPTEQALNEARVVAHDIANRVTEWEAMSSRELAAAAPAILRVRAVLTCHFAGGEGMTAADMAAFLTRWEAVTNPIPPGVLSRLRTLADAAVAAKTYHVGAARVGAGGGKRKLASGEAQKKQEAKAWARKLWEGWYFGTGKAFSNDVAFASEVIGKFPCCKHGAVARWPGEWRKEQQRRKG